MLPHCEIFFSLFFFFVAGFSRVMSSTAPPVLVECTRCGVVETSHRGHAVLTDTSGQILWALGDPHHITYPRSAIKYFQVMPLLMSGASDAYGFTDAEISVMCASHSGEPAHLSAVEGILAKSGCESSALQCGGHFPLGFEAGEALLRANQSITPLHNNCSGKHAGFLAYCKHTQTDQATHLSPSHPLQVAIRAEIAHFAGCTEADLVTGTDGCSAPTYALSLALMARAFANLAKPCPNPVREKARARVFKAVSEQPFFVGGTGRFCTDLMTAHPGRFLGKLGAEGFYGLCIAEKGWGLVVKMEDGIRGNQYNVVCAVLEALGMLGKGNNGEFEKGGALKEYLVTSVKTVVGELVGTKEVVKGVLDGLQKMAVC